MPIADTLPQWLERRRADAAGRLVDLAMPSTDLEDWRYSPIDGIDLRAYDAADAVGSGAPDVERLADAAAMVTVRNGRVESIEANDVGSMVGRLVDHADADSLLGSVLRRSGPVEALHDAALTDPVVIDVPRGAAIDAPIVIDVWSDGAGALTSPHTIVRAAAGSSVVVLERRRSGDADQLVLPTVELDVGPDARAGVLVIQDLGPHTRSVEQHAVRVGQQAHAVTALAALGGAYARTEVDFRLEGRGASGDLLSAYFGDGDQVLDFRTFQEHLGPDTTSNLLFKGAVTGSARSVYSGLIRVAESAPGTNAFQTNRNLKLSDDAWAYSVPNLEIEQNQVSCSHASTVGEIDEDQRFYLESRGVPPTIAEQLLVSGFFAEVIGAMPVAAVRAELQARIDTSLAVDRSSQEDAA